MCKYCEKIENRKRGQEALFQNQDIIIQVDIDTPIGLRRHQGGSMSVLHDKTKTDSFRINYCPYCGRKLNSMRRLRVDENETFALALKKYLQGKEKGEDIKNYLLSTANDILAYNLENLQGEKLDCCDALGIREDQIQECLKAENIELKIFGKPEEFMYAVLENGMEVSQDLRDFPTEEIALAVGIVEALSFLCLKRRV